MKISERLVPSPRIYVGLLLAFVWTTFSTTIHADLKDSTWGPDRPGDLYLGIGSLIVTTAESACEITISSVFNKEPSQFPCNKVIKMAEGEYEVSVKLAGRLIDAISIHIRPRKMLEYRL
jgi:hypothetical protein